MAKNDTRIKEMMAVVAEKRAALGDKPRASWKTNGIIKFDGGHINLNTVNSASILVDTLSKIISIKSSHEEAEKILGIKSPFEFNGNSFNDYVDDFKMRLAMIQYDEKKRALTASETRLAALVSEEARTEMELDAIEKSLE